MRWLEWIEGKLKWLSFPGLFKYIFFLGIVIFLCQWARPDIVELLDFDRAAILKGEVWRIFTFLPAGIGVMPFGALGIFFLFMGMMVAILVSDSLEERWGTARCTLYQVSSWLGLLAFQMATGANLGFIAEILFYEALFLAFATYFPKHEFPILFVLPVEVRFLAWISVAGLIYLTLKMPLLLIFILPGLYPYGLWVLPEVIRGTAVRGGAIVRRSKFQRAQMPRGEAFHRCETCGRTERDDSQLNFYTLPDGKEYCAEHLPKDAAGNP